MIESSILLGVFYRHHILHVLHHANLRAVSFGIGTDRTKVRIADVVAHTAIAHLMLQCVKRTGEGFHLTVRTAQHVEHKAQGCLAPYAGKFAEFAHSLLEQL